MRNLVNTSSVRVENRILDKIRKMSTAEGRMLSAQIRILLEEAIAAREGKK